MKQLIHNLIEKSKIDPSLILFIPLDDPVFVSKSISEIIESFRKINSHSFDKKIFLFFDEISYKDDFSRELKVINDNQNVKIFASGSNSLKLMDKKAFLTGRVFNMRVYPLNFEEFLRFRSISISEKDHHLKEKYFEEYLKIGGMPEYVLSNNPDFITELIDDLIYKDIARTFNLKNINKLKEIFILLCERIGGKISYNKLSKILGIDKETAAEYISYFQQTFLFNLVPKYSKSLNERIYSQKKVYICDNGIKNVFSGFRDIGSLFENYIHIELSKRFKDIFYFYENNKEIDFIIREGLKKEIAIEVKFRDIEKKDIEVLEKSKFKNKLLIQNYKDIKNFISKNN